VAPSSATPSPARDLARIVGAEHVIERPGREWLTDTSFARGLEGRADAVVLPGSAEKVAEVLAWCYSRGVAIVPRGGGTGYAGGAVPIDGGIVVGLGRMRQVRELAPSAWRMWVEAGLSTADVRRRARESGLLFAPDPGAAEQSQIGGNVATNAGGPHSFKYGVTGDWVTGLQVAVAPGELIDIGGPIRKDAAGYDLRGLFVGSEGTLGIITAVWLTLVPAPETTLPLLAFYPSVAAGCAAVRAVFEHGVEAAALEYFDAGTLRAAGDTLAGEVPGGAGFAVLAEADGAEPEARRVHGELVDALGPGSLELFGREPGPSGTARELWRWRDGVSGAVTAVRGGKLSEDIVVPIDRLAEAIDGTLALGERHGLEACSWGHAGDGNLHSTFLLSPGDREQLARAERAATELFDLAITLGGSVSGEHGIGWVKRGALQRQWPAAAVGLHRAIRSTFDPRGLLNPGKKEA
jgi:glycolate oxidase subunit GlcD